MIAIFICSWWLIWNMEEICSKNDLIKDRSIALIPGHSVTYQMTPLSLSKDFRIFFFFFDTKSVGFIGFQIKECRIGIGRAQVVLLQGEKSEIKYKKRLFTSSLKDEVLMLGDTLFSSLFYYSCFNLYILVLFFFFFFLDPFIWKFPFSYILLSSLHPGPSSTILQTLLWTLVPLNFS